MLGGEQSIAAVKVVFVLMDKAYLAVVGSWRMELN